MAERPASSEYREVQQRLARGWNTWDTRSVLNQVRLPDGLLISLGIKEYYRGWTLRSAQIGRRGEDDERVTFGPHAIDGATTEVTVAWQGIELRVRTAHAGDDLVVLVEPLRNQAKPAVLTAAMSFAWGRPGFVRDEGGVLTASCEAGTTALYATAADIDDPYVDVDGPRLVLPLTEPVGLSTGHDRDLSEIRTIVEDGQRALAQAAPNVHAEIVREAIAWNTLYEPSQHRVVTMVSRLWNVQKRGGFAMFCWDAFFGALLSGTVSRDLAIANVVEMLAEATPEGFVPNVSQGTGRVTLDGSQPPFASLISWELAKALDVPWLLRDAFEPLLAWNRWWWRVRRSGDMISPGSTWFEPTAPSPQDIPRIHQHFGATCESGADNDPAFSDAPFDPDTSLLRIHDIGLNSDYVLDCEYLARIATELGRPDEAAELTRRGDHVATAVRDRLWDPASRTYRNHFSDTGRPTAYLSPTIFFPMLAGLADANRARDLVERHLHDDAEFGGEWVVPVTPRHDPRSQQQSYWAGRIWPPINFLIYLGLRRAGRHDDAHDLAERSAALVLAEWRTQRHIHENYSGLTGEGCDVPNSEPFLTWGGLLSLIALIDAGDVDFFADWRAAPVLHDSYALQGDRARSNEARKEE